MAQCPHTWACLVRDARCDLEAGLGVPLVKRMTRHRRRTEDTRLIEEAITKARSSEGAGTILAATDGGAKDGAISGGYAFCGS